MRRNASHEFKGSVYIELESKEACEKFLNSEISFAGEPLTEKELLYS